MNMDNANDLDVQQQADRWFARLLAADCSVDEREAFDLWRRAPQHAAAYAQRERTWQQLGAPEVTQDPRVLALRARVLARTDASRAQVGSDWQQALATLPPRTRPAPASRGRQGRWWAMAASVVLVAAMLGLRFVHAPVPETIYVSTDALRSVDLADGTHVQLDLETELAVRDGKDTRSLALRRGRALFDVAHDARRPFTVDLGDSRVTVLGTRFQVLRGPGHVSVTLDRGSLRLDAAGRGAPARSETLAPGDQVEYAPQDPLAWRKRSVDSAALIAWSRGRLVFRATPLSEAVDQVNRYAHPRLRLADPALSGLQVSGNFIAGDGDLVASTWAATLPLRMEKQGDEIVLMAARR